MRRSSPLEFLTALARLSVHRHRDHGVLAPNARLRARVVALGRTEGEGSNEPPDRSPSRTPETPRNVAARSRWARLLARISEPEPVEAVLRHLGLPAIL